MFWCSLDCLLLDLSIKGSHLLSWVHLGCTSVRSSLSIFETFFWLVTIIYCYILHEMISTTYMAFSSHFHCIYIFIPCTSIISINKIIHYIHVSIIYHYISHCIFIYHHKRKHVHIHIIKGIMCISHLIHTSKNIGNIS